MKRLHMIAACAATLLATHTQAHVVLEYQVAMADSLYKATFKVGHGCGPSSTRQIVVSMPAVVRGARPMPKPGWSLEIARDKLARPYVEFGRTVTEDVVRITWTAKTPEDYLPTNQYDEFVLQARMPATAGPIYWPVNQICAEGRSDWVEQPGAGQGFSGLKSPAALLEILPGEGGGAHNH